MNPLFQAAQKINEAECLIGQLLQEDPAARSPRMSEAIRLLERALQKVRKEAVLLQVREVTCAAGAEQRDAPAEP